MSGVGFVEIHVSQLFAFFIETEPSDIVSGAIIVLLAGGLVLFTS